MKMRLFPIVFVSICVALVSFVSYRFGINSIHLENIVFVVTILAAIAALSYRSSSDRAAVRKNRIAVIYFISVLNIFVSGVCLALSLSGIVSVASFVYAISIVFSVLGVYTVFSATKRW